MPEDGASENGGAAYHKKKMSLVEKLAITAIVIGSSGFLLLTFSNRPVSGVQNPLLDNLALICYFVVLSSLPLLLWNVVKGQKSAQRYFKNVGFWLMAAAWVVLCVVVLMVLFDMIVPIWVAIWVATGALICMFIGFAVRLIEAGVRAWRWLDSPDA